MRRKLRILLVVLLLIAVAGCTAVRKTASGTSFDALREDPVRLRIFLAGMPKGGDLHNHLSGMIYAEDFLRMAADREMCLDPADGYTVRPGPCEGSLVPAGKALRDPVLWNDAINAWSTREDRRSSFMWDHDRFFASFFRFGPAGDDKGYMLAEAARQADRENVQYLELMLSIYPGDLYPLAGKANQAVTEGNFAAAYAALETAGLFDEAHLKESRERLTQSEARRDQLLKGGPGSEVRMRYINQIVRTLPPHEVFAMLSYSFALVAAEPRVVGLNLVAPEDDPVSMKDYGFHMDMIDWLYRFYSDDPVRRPLAERVNIALHAGELAIGLVEPEGLSDHIRLAVEKGHARRIGHGVALPYEKDPYEILRTMREKGIAIEILLSSNDIILHVSGRRHPLRLYMQEGVPFVFGSDDMGVARGDMTEEYMRAVLDQGLGYEDLKRATRNSLEYAFLPGSSLWADYENGVRVPQCLVEDAAKTCRECAVFLKENEKAAMQWELERRWAEFEKNSGL